MLVTFYAVDYIGSGFWTPPSGMTERYDVNGTYEDICAADALQVSSGATGTKTANCISADKGTAQIVALHDANPPAMMYVSSTTTQSNISLVPQGAVDQEIISMQVVTSGCMSPLTVTSFAFSTDGMNGTGTNNPTTNLVNAKMWYTGTSSTFATTTQFGTTTVGPNGSFTVAGTQALSTGTNYFWLTYSIQAGATLGDKVDASCSSINIVTAQTPSVTNPVGSRTITDIVPPTYQCVSKANCGCFSLSVALPSCVIQNDLMIAHVTYRPNTGDNGIAAPAGWNRIYYGTNSNAQTTMDVFYKVATSSEPGSYTFTQTSNGSDMSIAITVYRGVDVTDPIESAAGTITPAGTSHTTPCITATTDQAMIVTWFSQSNCSTCDLNDAVWTAPTGMTERYDIGKVQSSWQGGCGDDVVQPYKGCVQKTATSSMYASWGGIAAIAALRPAGAIDAYTSLYLGNNTNFNSGSSVTLSKPSTSANDLMVVHISAGYSTSPGATPPAGWTLARHDNNANTIASWIYYKLATASEPSSYTFSVSTGFNVLGSISVYSGIDPSSPFDVSAGATTSGTNHTAPSINTTTDSALVITAYSLFAQATYAPPASTTERYDYANVQNHWKTISGDDFISGAAGATGTQTATTSSAAAGTAQIVAFKRLPGSIVIGGCCGFQMQNEVLPVTWIDVTATAVDSRTVEVQWTVVETRCQSFTVERSPDGAFFGDVETVAGSGTTSQPRTYQYMDYPDLASVIYYRIRQTDFDGSVSYSSIRSVRLDNQTQLDLLPNPTTGATHLYLLTDMSASVTVEVSNVAGQVLTSQSHDLDAGRHLLPLDLSALPMGVYFVNVTSDRLLLNRKLLVQKQ